MKTIRKIFIFLAIIISTKTKTIYAIDIYSNTDGNSVPVVLPDCFYNKNGCGGISQTFDIRITIVGANGQKVGGTTPVELYSQSGKYFQAVDVGGEVTNPSRETLNPNSSQNYFFTGSSFAKQGDGRLDESFNLSGNDAYKANPGYYWSDTAFNGRYYSIPTYYVYLGTGDYPANDFTGYAQRRLNFIDFASNIYDREIYVGDIGEKVSFINFFLKVSRFAETAGYTGWDADYDAKVKAKIASNDYYLLVEPVYTMNLRYNNMEHTVHGTAKQLAEILSKSYSFDWFWPGIYYENLYNLYCNFIDYSGFAGLSTDGDWRCGSSLNFDGVTQDRLTESEIARNCSKLTGTAYTECKKYQQNNSNVINAPGHVNKTHYNKIYNDLKSNETAMGINVLSLNDIINEVPNTPEITTETVIENTPVTVKNTCEYKITTCENNGPSISAKLSGTDLYECVHPSTTIGTDQKANEIAQYIKKYNDDIYCYDDVSYNFNTLLGYYYATGSTFNRNTLVEIPDGTLKINRTCYTTKKDDKNITSALTTTSNKDYQSPFFLNFMGPSYSYSISDTPTNNPTNEGCTEKKSSNGEKYYECKSTIEYQYSTTSDNRIYDNKACLNIYNFLDNENGKYNSNCVLFASNFNKSGTALVTAEEGSYTNQITGSSKYTGSKYGYSENIYRKFKDSANKQATVSTTKTSSTGEKTVQDSEFHYTIHKYQTTYTVENTYKLTINEQSCTFDTTIVDNDVFGDGVQFRIISLSNPFPARDGTKRLPGINWLNDKENNVYDYIQNNRNVTEDDVYNKEPLYTITLDTAAMIKIREYNKEHSYKDIDLTCETGTGRMCISSFLRNTKYISDLEGTCSSLNPESNEFNNFIKTSFIENNCGISSYCLNERKNTVDIDYYDTNKDGKIDANDFIDVEFYSCADKSTISGG